MAKFLIDENLPDKFSFWNPPEFIFQKDILPSASDLTVRGFAKAHQLVIVSKDIDFYHLHLFYGAPPKVILFRTGNMRIREFFVFVEEHWVKISELSMKYDLVMAYKDRIEGL
jgi:predicted nuclease of predicted toxin-antitoxin system